MFLEGGSIRQRLYSGSVNSKGRAVDGHRPHDGSIHGLNNRRRKEPIAINSPESNPVGNGHGKINIASVGMPVVLDGHGVRYCLGDVAHRMLNMTLAKTRGIIGHSRSSAVCCRLVGGALEVAWCGTRDGRRQEPLRIARPLTLEESL